eukprot:6699781-Alexandrium_andersonii.AAC.1
MLELRGPRNVLKICPRRSCGVRSAPLLAQMPNLLYLLCLKAGRTDHPTAPSPMRKMQTSPQAFGA